MCMCPLLDAWIIALLERVLFAYADEGRIQFVYGSLHLPQVGEAP